MHARAACLERHRRHSKPMKASAKPDSKVDVKAGAVASNVVAFPKTKTPPNSGGSAPSEANHEYKHDCETLSGPALKKKYPLTYNTWRGTVARAEEQGVALDPRFVEFRDFLLAMGPRPAKNITLDRIDHKGPYTVENCRWADKKKQSQNRGNAVKITCDGEPCTVEELAARLKCSTSSIYKKLKLGWTPEEIIKGREKKTVAKNQNSAFPWPSYRPGLWHDWEAGYQEGAEWLNTFDGLRRESRLRFYVRKTAEVLKSIKSMLERDESNAELVAAYEQAQRNFLDAREKAEWEGERKRLKVRQP